MVKEPYKNKVAGKPRLKQAKLLRQSLPQEKKRHEASDQIMVITE